VIASAPSRHRFASPIDAGERKAASGRFPFSQARNPDRSARLGSIPRCLVAQIAFLPCPMQRLRRLDSPPTKPDFRRAVVRVAQAWALSRMIADRGRSFPNFEATFMENIAPSAPLPPYAPYAPYAPYPPFPPYPPYPATVVYPPQPPHCCCHAASQAAPAAPATGTPHVPPSNTGGATGGSGGGQSGGGGLDIGGILGGILNPIGSILGLL
jgi:hypothetical protein